MFIDHAGLALFPEIGAFRCVGRLAFPLYCFLLTQGYRHSRDRRAYARRLLLLALLSEVPFDLLIFGRLSCAVEQNVLFSLLLGLMALRVFDALRDQPLPAAAALCALGVAAMAARVSFGWLGIALCLCCSVCGERRSHLAASLSAVLLIYTLSLFLSGVAHSWVLVSLCSLFAIPFILYYNGRRGMRHPVLTFLFYAAYPAHLTLLVFVRAMRIVPPYLF